MWLWEQVFVPLFSSEQMHKQHLHVAPNKAVYLSVPDASLLSVLLSGDTSYWASLFMLRYHGARVQDGFHRTAQFNWRSQNGSKW